MPEASPSKCREFQGVLLNRKVSKKATLRGAENFVLGGGFHWRIEEFKVDRLDSRRMSPQQSFSRYEKVSIPFSMSWHYVFFGRLPCCWGWDSLVASLVPPDLMQDTVSTAYILFLFPLCNITFMTTSRLP